MFRSYLRWFEEDLLPLNIKYNNIFNFVPLKVHLHNFSVKSSLVDISLVRFTLQSALNVTS
jgi:hypothetical protein